MQGGRDDAGRGPGWLAQCGPCQPLPGLSSRGRWCTALASGPSGRPSSGPLTQRRLGSGVRPLPAPARERAGTSGRSPSSVWWTGHLWPPSRRSPPPRVSFRGDTLPEAVWQDRQWPHGRGAPQSLGRVCGAERVQGRRGGCWRGGSVPSPRPCGHERASRWAQPGARLRWPPALEGLASSPWSQDGPSRAGEEAGEPDRRCAFCRGACSEAPAGSLLQA